MINLKSNLLVLMLLLILSPPVVLSRSEWKTKQRITLSSGIFFEWWTSEDDDRAVLNGVLSAP